MFSFHIAGNRQQSIVTIGGYNLSYANLDSTVTWNDVIDSHYWSLNLVDAKLGQMQIKLTTNFAIVDSGTSYILMPKCKHSL